MPDAPAPKRDPREPTPGAPGLSSEEFERMMEELESGIKRSQDARKTPKPLSVESALEAQKPEGITKPEAALGRTAARRAMERMYEERRRQLRRERDPFPARPLSQLRAPGPGERPRSAMEDAKKKLNTMREKEQKKSE